MPCSTVVHIISRQSLLFYFVQPSSLSSSSLSIPSPLYFHYHRPPSYAVFLSSHHMPIPLQPCFLYFLCDFPHFRCPLILSFLISYSFVTPHIHRSILISATSNFFSCAFFNAHVSAPTSVLVLPLFCNLPLDLHVHSTVAQHYGHSFAVLPPALHSAGDLDLRTQFSILRQRRSQVCEYLHSLYRFSL